MTEFELIERWFTRPAPGALVGNGDDAAVIAPSADHVFVVTTDTLIEGRHFFPGLAPEKIGRRAVAVNLSDLAAMGAKPRFALLSLALPEIDAPWVTAFAEGLFEALDAHGVELVGGNTTRGPLAVGLTALGEVPLSVGQPQALLRSGAQPGDDLWVSGPLGDAGWACLCLLGEVDAVPSAEQLARYECPVARVALGLALRPIATAAIDISDGLVSEARHLARASKVKIEIDARRIPTGLAPHLDDPRLGPAAWRALLATGDAYELLFTAPPGARPRIEAILAGQGHDGARIGRVLEAEAGEVGKVRVLDAHGQDRAAGGDAGWDHFA
ncbi:MAG: thiamine-phosphate kinase [Casimicrobiaceae bacterium]